MKKYFSSMPLGADVVMLLIRLACGLPMLCFHGWPKLTSFGEHAETFPDPLGVGSPASLGLSIFAELLCAAAITVGFLTRLAAIPYAFAMVVAAFVIHSGDPLADRELALIFLALGIATAVGGSGRYSVDKMIFG